MDSSMERNLDLELNEAPVESLIGLPSDNVNEEQTIKEEPNETFMDETRETFVEERNETIKEEPREAFGEEPIGTLNEEATAVSLDGGTTVSQYDDLEKKDNAAPITSEKRWPGWPGESVFRILVPAQKVGALIGRKGDIIKKICEESKAKIKILEGPPGLPERAVIISAKEEPDVQMPPAIDGLLRVHRRIVNGLDEESVQHLPNTGNLGPTRLLVPAAQAGNLIGKQGATIKSIQEDSGSAVKIIENVPPIALADDRVVEIQGDPASMHKAVELIAAQLRKFLLDRSVLPQFEMHIAKQGMQRGQPMQPSQNWPSQPWGPPQNMPPLGGPAYGQFMPPPHDYYPPHDRPMDKRPHYGISAYGHDAPPAGIPPTVNQQSPYMPSQVTQSMQIPLSYADAVIGTAGANISYIRRASGATVTIQESRAAPGEMTVEITGTAAQVQTAEQLIQNFMADVGAPAANAAASQGAVGQGDPNYHSYAPYGSYGAPHGGSVPQNAGGYGAPYSANQGY